MNKKCATQHYSYCDNNIHTKGIPQSSPLKHTRNITKNLPRIGFKWNSHNDIKSEATVPTSITLWAKCQNSSDICSTTS